MGRNEAELAQALRSLGVHDIHVEIIAGSGRWIAEESRSSTAAAIPNFAASLDQTVRP